MKNKICFIDFETTGIDVFKDNPIELGAVLVNSSGKVLEKFSSLIRPRTKRSFSAAAKSIHGLDHSQLLNAPSQREVLNEFFTVVGTDYRFGGWNVNFDVTFFRRMCHNNDRMSDFNKIYHRHIDVQTISFLANNLGIVSSNINSLDNLAALFKLHRSNNHSALEDAIITKDVYFGLRELFKKHELAS